MLLTVAALTCQSGSALSSAETDLQLLYTACAKNGDAFKTFVDLLPVRTRIPCIHELSLILI